MRRLGGGWNGQHEITILHRTLRWCGSEIELEADPRHVIKLCEELGSDASSTGLEGPAMKETRVEIVKEDPEIENQSGITRYRSLAATGGRNFCCDVAS